jgi:hypothetical protein
MVFTVPDALLREYAARVEELFPGVRVSESQMSKFFMKKDITRKQVCSV